jgi:hypothetical protein
MHTDISPRDYIDARNVSNALLSEAAFGDSPAGAACAAASSNLVTIAAWGRTAARRSRRLAA